MLQVPLPVLKLCYILVPLLYSGLLSKLLLANPEARINIADIQKDRWFTQGKAPNFVQLN